MQSVSLIFILYAVFSLSSCSTPDATQKNIKTEYFTGGQIRTQFIMSDSTSLNGVLLKYGYSGELTSKAPIQDGVPHGEEIWYDTQGKIILRVPYVEGRKDGVQKAFYPNGEIMIVHTYKNGVKHGKTVVYDKKGKVLKKATFKNGQLL